MVKFVIPVCGEVCHTYVCTEITVQCANVSCANRQFCWTVILCGMWPCVTG